MTKPLRLAFMGSPDIAAHVLDALITAGHPRLSFAFLAVLEMQDATVVAP